MEEYDAAFFNHVVVNISAVVVFMRWMKKHTGEGNLKAFVHSAELQHLL